MKSLLKKFRAVDIKHSCFPDEENEQINHSKDHYKVISTVTDMLNNMHFDGIIESEKNDYQLNLNFDNILLDSLKDAGWQSISTEDIRDNENISKMMPDAILTMDNMTVVIEIEKSNKWTIWFDFMKIFSYNEGIADFGMLIVPRNWAHSKGVWDLFKAARKYLWYLYRYAKADEKILSKIAIIGYTQEVLLEKEWKKLTRGIRAEIKKEAKELF